MDISRIGTEMDGVLNQPPFRIAAIASNLRAMGADGITVWLDVPLELLYARCSENPELQPLFAGREEMAQLLERRCPFYARARLHIQTGNASVEEIARRIFAGLAGSCH